MRPKGKILIVDDEPLNVKLIKAKLLSEQYQTISAFSGEEALEKVESDSPDLILLDIMMPGMNGYEVTEQIKNDPATRNIPIILITALDGSNNKIKGLESGADEFLNKPVNTAELLARVQSLLRLKQYQDQLKMHQGSQELLTRPFEGDTSPDNRIDLPSLLLVEDDEKDAQLIQMQLYGQPYRMKVVQTGEEALSCAQQEKIDLIILDILLPGVDGFDVSRELKGNESTSNIQIVAVTNLKDMESKVKGLKLGVDDYLVKPINMHEFRARINALIKKKAYLDKLKTGYESAVHSAITDRLTGLYNYAYFHYFLENEIKRSERHHHPVALIMMDIDDFKHFNDSMGHLAGDEILKQLGRLIREDIREIDLGVRYGGEEFAIVMPYTDLKGAINMARRIKSLIKNHSFMVNNFPPASLTVSMGIAVYPENALTSTDLIQGADTALYGAKNGGKDRIYMVDDNSNAQPIAASLK
ncbi:MAG: response regulator [Thermodesulfobacteriota bacterium]|nr:response regulator [Thermodesulfobacteriota bacterium]